MPKLPDASSLGAPAIPQGRQSIQTYDPTKQSNAAENALRGVMQSQEGLYRAQQGVRDSMQGFGKTVGEIQEKAQDRRDRAELANARMSWMKADLETQTELAQDPDYSTWNQKYAAKMGPIREKIRGGFSNAEQAGLFDMDMDLGMARAKAELTTRAFKAEGDQNIAMREGQLEELKRMHLAATDPYTKNRIAEEGRLQIDALSPYIGKGAAMDRGRKWSQEVAFNENMEEALNRPNEWLSKIKPAVQTGGEADPMATLISRISYAESRGNRRAVNKKSGAAGSLQFMPGTAADYEVDDPHDPKQAEAGARKKIRDDIGFLKSALKREPTGEEIYLAWQQGPGGAPALLTNQQRPAIDVLTEVYARKHPVDKAEEIASDAIRNNGGRIDMTAGEFARQQMAKFSRTDPNGYLGYMQPRGDSSDLLTVEQMMTLENKAKSAAKERQAEFRSTIEVGRKDRIAMAQGGTDDPAPLSLDDFTSAYGDEGFKQFDAYTADLRTSKDMFALGGMSPAEQERVIQGHAPVAGEGYAAGSERQAELIKAARDINETREKDPMGFFQSRALGPQEPLTWDEPEKLAAQIERRGTTARQLQEEWGVPFTPLTKAEADGMSKMLAGLPADQRLGVMAGLANGMRDDDSLRGVVNQLRDGSPVTAIAASLLAKDMPQKNSLGVQPAQVAQRLMAGEDLINPPKKDGKEVGKFFPMPEPDKLRDEFAVRTEGVFSNMPEYGAEMFQSVRAYYAALSSEAGDGSGELNDPRLDEAIKHVVGNVEKVNDRTPVRLPWGMDEADFVDRMEQAMPSALARMGLDPARFRFNRLGFRNTGDPNVFAVTVSDLPVQHQKGKSYDLLKVNINDTGPALAMSE